VQKNTVYLNDPAWLSWLALVDCETKALADHFDSPALTALDNSLLEHRRRFKAVKEYEGCLKPKHLLRANYPWDIWYTGPLIRTWCMTFEAVLQVLKNIAHNSNYKNVNERIARIWAIRTALSQYDSKLTHWNDMKLTYSKWTAVVKSGHNGIELVPNKHVTELDEFCKSVRPCGACNAHVASTALMRAMPATCTSRARCVRVALRARCVRVACVCVACALRARCVPACNVYVMTACRCATTCKIRLVAHWR
jgi:hypothetical protein